MANNSTTNIDNKWHDLIGDDWEGELLSGDVIDELLESADEDPSAAKILARLEKTREELYQQKHHEYAVPYDYASVWHEDEDGNPYQVDVVHCDNCGKFECDYSWCIDNAFLGNTPDTQFLCNAAQLIKGREYDQVASNGPDVINDTFLVLAQGTVTLDDFNAHVGEFYKAANPGKTFDGWSFTLTIEENPEEGFTQGVFAAKEEYAEAVAKALNAIAKALDNGEYTVERF